MLKNRRRFPETEISAVVFPVPGFQRLYIAALIFGERVRRAIGFHISQLLALFSAGVPDIHNRVVLNQRIENAGPALPGGDEIAIVVIDLFRNHSGVLTRDIPDVVPEKLHARPGLVDHDELDVEGRAVLAVVFPVDSDVGADAVPGAQLIPPATEGRRIIVHENG